jgi:hypothetical protein
MTHTLIRSHVAYTLIHAVSSFAPARELNNHYVALGDEAVLLPSRCGFGQTPV